MHVHLAKWADERKIRARFAFAMALLLVLGAVLYQATLKFRDTEQWEARMEAALAKFDAISSQLQDAETGERGYLITGEERYMAPYRAAMQSIDQELGDLQPLIADDLSFQQKLNTLTPIITTKLAAMTQLYNLRKNHRFEPAAQVALIDKDQRLMDTILQLSSELEAEQNQFLQQKTDAADARDQTINLSITFGSFLAMILAAFMISRDITERMQAYQMLERRVEERTHEIERRRQVAEGLRDIMTILNSNRPLDEILDSIVAQACRLLGTDAGAVYHLQEQKGLLCTQVAHGLDADDAAIDIPVGWSAVGEAVLNRQPVVASNALVALAEENDPVGARISRRLASLFSHYGAWLVVPLMVKDDIYGAIALYYRRPREFTSEETELAVALGDQAALAIENARLRTQAEQMAVAAERSRLARDLHDAVTQTLFSTSLIADVLPRLWERDQKEGRRRLDELRQLTRGALAEMRTLLLELRPATLAEVEVAELLHQLTEAIISRARVPIALMVDGQCRLPPDVQIAVYRITQEALNNMAHHADASQVAVSLHCGADTIVLRISDDGQGFRSELCGAGASRAGHHARARREYRRCLAHRKPAGLRHTDHAHVASGKRCGWRIT